MIIIDNREYMEERLSVERKKLEQSLAIYRMAIANNYACELPFLLKRVERNQRDFQRMYEKLNPLGVNKNNYH